MPELPDVEIFKQYVDATSLHKTIDRVEVRNAKILKGVSPAALSRSLKGRAFQKTRRHGKYLLVEVESGPWLILHFGMTGYIRYFKEMDDDLAHGRVLWRFANGFHLAFICQRMLGGVSLAEDVAGFIQAKKLGPDAAALDLDAFTEILQGKRGAIKSFLMNQHYLAGLGNVYADEILFRSGIHPKTGAPELTGPQIERIFRNMLEVIEVAIACRADPNGSRLTSSCPGDAGKDNVPGPTVPWSAAKFQAAPPIFAPAVNRTVKGR
jgi:formamidopyrimidine-DNA glycosylase